MGDDEEKKKKQMEIEKKRAEVRARMEEASKAKKAKKGFMTPERKKKLRLLLRKKAAEELKKEQERKAAERRRIIEERCGNPKPLDGLNDAQLKKVIQDYYNHMYRIENQKWDLELEVQRKHYEIADLNSQVNDLRGKFIKPTLKKVSKYENKFAKLQKKAAEFNFRNQLKVVKKKEFTLEEEDKEKKPDWSKKSGEEKKDGEDEESENIDENKSVSEQEEDTKSITEEAHVDDVENIVKEGEEVVNNETVQVIENLVECPKDETNLSENPTEPLSSPKTDDNSEVQLTISSSNETGENNNQNETCAIPTETNLQTKIEQETQVDVSEATKQEVSTELEQKIEERTITVETSVVIEETVTTTVEQVLTETQNTTTDNSVTSEIATAITEPTPNPE